MFPAAKIRSCLGAVVVAYTAAGSAQTVETEQQAASQPESPSPPRYRRYHRNYDHHHIFHDSVVRFEPDSPGLQLWAYTGVVPVERVVWGYHYGAWYHRGYAPMYSPVCDGPCAVPMPSGHYQLALSQDGGTLVPVHSSILIDGPAEIRGKYIDRSGTRTAGVVIGIGGMITGVIMLGVAERDNDVCDNNGCYTGPTKHGALAAGGVGVILGSVIVGAVLISQHDEAIISVRPLTLGSVGSARPVTSVFPVLIHPPQGGSLSISF